MFASNKEDAIDEDLDQYLDDHEESDDDEDDDDEDDDDEDDDDEDHDDELNKKDVAADNDDDDFVVENVVLSNTFEELMTRTDLDLLSYIMYDPSTSSSKANKETEDSVMDDTKTQTKPNNNRKYVWTSPDCCCRDVEMVSNLPSKLHKYQLDMIITKKQYPTTEGGEELEPRQYKIQISGPNDISVGPTVMGLLLLLLSPKISSTTSTNNNDISNITFHAFATNPRIPFPTISKQMLSSLLSLTTYHTAMTSSSLTLAFVNINDSSTIPTLLSLGHFPSVELRQCSTDNDNNNNVYSNILYYGNDNTTFTNLIISCSQMEFTKFATQWYDYEFPSLSAAANPNNPTIKSPIKMLHLKLHFWLQGPAIASLCSVLRSTNISVEHLTIEYLDIIDDAWNQIFHAISFSTTIKYLKISFTDNFVDNYRRMTPERRTARTDAVLQCVTNNKMIEEIHWPIFQQDETLMTTINTTLQSNKMNKMIIM